MLVACLWPFEFHPANEVMHVPGELGLRFHGHGTAYSREPFPSLPQLSKNNELTIEMTVRPTRIFDFGVPSILSFSSEQGPSALVIGAWKQSLVVRLGRHEESGWEKYREIGVGDIFTPGRTVHLVISLGPRGTIIFVDGRLERSYPAACLRIPAMVTTQSGLMVTSNRSVATPVSFL